tara:strand:+ start:6885 stop:7289 length:405 start_codon:yes stop_codon:yes gene_type:complete
MPKFITINGTKAWISNKDSMVEARTSAINICDHSEEVIVRPIEDFTDYTREYYNKPADDILDYTEIDEVMKIYGLSFTKSDDSSHGFVGGLFSRADSSTVAIFDKCFYVRNPQFPLNDKTLLLIKALQYWNKTQ